MVALETQQLYNNLPFYLNFKPSYLFCQAAVTYETQRTTTAHDVIIHEVSNREFITLDIIINDVIV